MSHLEENQLVTPQRTDSTRKRDREDPYHKPQCITTNI